jgi:hypothetical protein
MNLRYIVDLMPEERDQLKTPDVPLTVGGVAQVRRIDRAKSLPAGTASAA